MIRRTLLDVNVLIAIAENGHEHYQKAQQWFMSPTRQSWGICPITEAGFLRITTSPAFRPGPRTLEQSIAVVQSLKEHPDQSYWPIGKSWVSLTAPFAKRILGHQQVTDAYLLGLAVEEDGVLVTFDRGLKYMAGAEFSRNLLVLE